MQRNGKAPTSTNGLLIDEPLPPPSAAITLLDAGSPAPAGPDADEPAPARKLSAATGASIDAQLVAARIAIEMVLGDAGMQARMAAYGYDAERMRAGRALHERALALHQQQQAGYGDRYAATDARNAAQTQAHTIYMRHLTVARVALRNDRGAAQALGLASTRKTGRAGWLGQAQQFYANALADTTIALRLAPFGATASQLRDAQGLVASVAAKLVAQQAAREAALALTRQRNAALDALHAWMRDFRAIARIALGE